MKEPISAPISLRWDYDLLMKSGLQHEKIPPTQGGIFFSEAEAVENGLGPKSRKGYFLLFDAHFQVVFAKMLDD